MKPVAKLSRKPREVRGMNNLMFQINQSKQKNIEILRTEYLTFIAMLFGHRIDIGEVLVNSYHSFTMGELSEEFLLRALMLRSERGLVERQIEEQKKKEQKEQDELLSRLRQQSLQEQRNKR